MRSRAEPGGGSVPVYAVVPEDALEAARREVKKWRLDRILRTSRICGGSHIRNVRDLKPYSSASRTKLSLCVESASATLWRFHTPPRTEGTWHHCDDAAKRAHHTEETAVIWNEPSRQLLETYGNAQEATEMGAYAIALAVADQLGFTVIGRARQSSGSDWVMIRKGEPSNDYYRLEVSGMAAISQEKPEQRLARKVEQLRAGDMRRPGVAVVVRFEDVRVLSEVTR